MPVPGVKVPAITQSPFGAYDKGVLAALMSGRMMKSFPVMISPAFNSGRALPRVAGCLVERAFCQSTDDSAPFFVSHDGGHLPARTVENVFRRLQPGLGWHARGDHPYPRIHDLRHTMAVRRLQRWRESGQSIEHAMFWLCTYLGHAKISDTYWYLSGIPELMDTIGARFERFVGIVVQGGER